MVSTECKGTTEKEIKQLYPQETHYICKKDQNSESTIKWKNQYELKHKGGRNYKKNQWKKTEGEGRNKKAIWSIKRATSKG